MKLFETAILTIVTAALAGCGGGDDMTIVSVAKSLGSVQCAGGGQSLAALEGQLRDVGVGVVAGTCGHDGIVRPAVCGASDGRIAIVDIDADQLPAASSLGFVPLDNLPFAQRAPCP